MLGVKNEEMPKLQSATDSSPTWLTQLDYAAIEQLMDKPMSVNELAAALGQEQSMISPQPETTARLQLHIR